MPKKFKIQHQKQPRQPVEVKIYLPNEVENRRPSNTETAPYFKSNFTGGIVIIDTPDEL